MHAYQTILKPQRKKTAVGACRFYASLAPCRTEKEARQFLEQVKMELPGATHHAFALRIGYGEQILARSDDAGEPAGTAGPPLLLVLEKNELTNLVLVATRYFGGVKLGIGGLLRAYRACAEAGVKSASIIRREIEKQASLVLPYDCLGAVVRELEALHGKVTRFNYGRDVTLDVVFPLREQENLSSRVRSASRGQAKMFIKDH